jgi:hypothetical protein
MGIAWGFVLKNPIPETLTGHGLRAIKGVLGVLFQLPGNFKKNDHPYRLDQSGSPGKIFSATEKNPKYPKNPFFALRPETATGLYYYFMLKLLLGG